MYKLFYLFSDWIFIWYILYRLQLINNNPKIFIIFGIIENIISLIYLCKYTSNIKKYYILIIHFIIKILMIISLSDTQIVFNDFIFGLILYIIYNIWLKIKYNKYITEFYIEKLTHNKLLQN
jgi:hypothetical protein